MRKSVSSQGWPRLFSRSEALNELDESDAGEWADSHWESYLDSYNSECAKMEAKIIEAENLQGDGINLASFRIYFYDADLNFASSHFGSVAGHAPVLSEPIVPHDAITATKMLCTSPTL